MPAKKGARKSAKPTLPLLKDAPLVGREREQAHLAQTLREQRFPPTLLLSGNEGVGKQRMAYWIAQLLLCPAPQEAGPCGECPDCRMARNLSHPDLHAFLPHASVGSGSPDALVEKVEEARAVLLEARRSNALYGPHEPGAMYYLSTVRTLHRKAANRPYREGGRKVILLIDADRLSAFDGGADAANALLKALEEPAEGTHYILTTAAAHRVLPTIRSRAGEFKLAPVTDVQVQQALQQGLPDFQAEDEDCQRAIYLAQGSVGRALNYLSDPWKERRTQALQLIEAVIRLAPEKRFEILGKQGFKGARTDFSDLLSHVRDLCVQAMAYSVADPPPMRVDPALIHALGEASQSLRSAPGWTTATRAAMQALREAKRNANPQLVLHRLLLQMERALHPR